MTRADDLTRIQKHLESALFIAQGLPDSPHQRCLVAELERQYCDAVRLYETGEKRAQKGRAV